MAREEFNAAYVGSNDYWGYDSDSFNEETQWFGESWVVPASKVTPEKIREDGLSRCALYYEVGRTDSHLFTPLDIIYDDDTGFLLINGTQGRIGEPGATVARRRAYPLGKVAQRYKNMMASSKSSEPGRFTINYIDVSNEPGKEDIIEFIDTLDEEETVEASAESFSAETLNRINPQFVEGAEDVMGAEDTSDNDISNVILHSEDSSLEVHTNDGGSFRADIDSGIISQDSSQFAAEDSEPLSAEDIGFLLSLTAETDDSYASETIIPATSPGPSSQSANQTYMEDWEGGAEDIVATFQELPLLRDFRMNGWIASAAVVAIAGLTGAYLARSA